VALAALVPLLAGTTPAERVHAQLLIVLFPAALAFGALLGLVLVQWRARRLAADTLRRTARELQRGAWRSAVERMRDMPPAEPSAFGDLADQVEGVMGESERRWQARVELSQEWYWESDERHRLSSLSADAPIVKPAGRALGDLLGAATTSWPSCTRRGGWPAFNQMLERHEGFRELELEVEGLGGHARLDVAHRPPALSPRWPLRRLRGRGPRHHCHKESFRRLQASEQRYAVLAACRPTGTGPPTPSTASSGRRRLRRRLGDWPWPRGPHAGSCTRTHYRGAMAGAPRRPRCRAALPRAGVSHRTRRRHANLGVGERRPLTTTGVSSATTVSAATSRCARRPSRC
jgi:hypothetical protein